MSSSTATPRLGNVLIERGYITVEQLNTALNEQRSGGGKLLGEIIAERGFCSDDQIIECLATVYGVPYAKLEPRIADPRIVDCLPREYIEKNLVFPLFKIRGTLTIAVTEPTNLFLIDELHALTNLDVQVVATSAKDLRRMITTLPDSKTFVIDDIIEDNAQAEVTLIETAIDDIGDMAEFAGQSPVIRLVNYIIYNAVKEGASDIHIEPGDRCLRIRNRIDGRLYKALEVPLNLLGAVTSRIKIMASLDISERRLPQDGRVHVLLDGRKIDLRVSTFPASRGEKTVIRVLDTRSVSLNLRDLGFAEDILEPLQSAIQAPNGIILVTGPTGSGKSTTLYAALNEIASMENNICTVEDPIEYHLSLINQFQVQERVGLTFSKALRTLLRQDPDVIMVGEIRDEETARTAIQAALTGHLVFSTLHTNDAASAITRLADLGVPSYLIAATVIGVLAQRLARTLCPACKVRDEETTRESLDELARPWRLSGGVRPYRPVGCLECRHTGFRGRAGLYELMVLTEAARACVHPALDAAALRRQAYKDGMRALRLAGAMKVAEGQTTIEEVLRSTPGLGH